MWVTLTSSTKLRLSAHQFNEIPTWARGLAWPILGGWGPSDPSSNLGGPTNTISDSVSEKLLFDRRVTFGLIWGFEK